MTDSQLLIKASEQGMFETVLILLANPDRPIKAMPKALRDRVNADILERIKR